MRRSSATARDYYTTKDGRQLEGNSRVAYGHAAAALPERDIRLAMQLAARDMNVEWLNMAMRLPMRLPAGVGARILRQRALDGKLEPPGGVTETEHAARTRDVAKRICAFTVDDMPASVVMVRLLVFCVCLRLGNVPQGPVWQACGIPERTGEHYASGDSHITWPVWRTLRGLALDV